MKIQNYQSTNFGQLRPSRLKKEIPPEIQKVAGSMESLFVKHLFDEMRKTVPKEKKEDAITSFYSKLLDGERAQLVSLKGKGLGLKEIIAKQLMEGNKNSY